MSAERTRYTVKVAFPHRGRRRAKGTEVDLTELEAATLRRQGRIEKAAKPAAETTTSKADK